jgi:hypothetical protein
MLLPAMSCCHDFLTPTTTEYLVGTQAGTGWKETSASRAGHLILSKLAHHWAAGAKGFDLSKSYHCTSRRRNARPSLRDNSQPPRISKVKRFQGLNSALDISVSDFLHPSVRHQPHRGALVKHGLGGTSTNTKKPNPNKCQHSITTTVLDIDNSGFLSVSSRLLKTHADFIYSSR